MFPNFAGNMEDNLLWPKILYDCIQNLVRLRIYKTLTRTREVKQGRIMAAKGRARVRRRAKDKLVHALLVVAWDMWPLIAEAE